MSCKIGSQCFIDKNGIDLENKTIPLILSDESKVLRFDWENGLYDLILEHSDSAIDLSRKDILPVLLQHDTNMLPIGIYENVRLENSKLKALARFDTEDELGMKVFSKMSRGFMPTVSVGITIHEKMLFKEEAGKKTYKATKWEITEASIVTVPANPNAKVGLSLEANPTASGDNSKKNNIGADMVFDRENLDATEVAFKALVLNRDTLTNRLNSLELNLQTANTALATKTEEMEALKATIEAKVTEAEGKIESFKAEMTTRLSEAVATGLNTTVALEMVKAETAEEASRIALKAKETDGRTQQSTTYNKEDAWADFKPNKGAK